MYSNDTERLMSWASGILLLLVLTGINLWAPGPHRTGALLAICLAFGTGWFQAPLRQLHWFRAEALVVGLALAATTAALVLTFYGAF